MIIKTRISDRILIQDRPKAWQRPKAVYTNNPSPYGIADELFERKLIKQCYAK